MSKNINVNPGQYKVKGRERQGEDIVQEDQKKTLSKYRKGKVSQGKRSKKR